MSGPGRLFAAIKELHISIAIDLIALELSFDPEAPAWVLMG
jgi:hypothetical protein